jgi:DNA-binding NarL/FixJ family response regulator
MNTEKITIAVIDDHALIRQALTNLIQTNGEFTVVFDAANGLELQHKLKQCPQPEIVLLDLAMPEMDGYEVTLWLKANYPDIKILIMSVNDSEEMLYQMVRAGINGYILKESDLDEVLRACKEIKKNGCYFSSRMQIQLASIVKRSQLPEPSIKENVLLNKQEARFLELLCTEMSYNDICSAMHISYHTLDNYRDAIYRKLNVKSRTGSVLYAVRHGLVQL